MVTKFLILVVALQASFKETKFYLSETLNWECEKFIFRYLKVNPDSWSWEIAQKEIAYNSLYSLHVPFYVIDYILVMNSAMQ